MYQLYSKHHRTTPKYVEWTRILEMWIPKVKEKYGINMLHK